MMMKKHIFLTLLLMIVAQGTWAQEIGTNYYPKVFTSPPTEGPWTFDDVITHLGDLKNNDQKTITFNGANRYRWAVNSDHSGFWGYDPHEYVYQFKDGDGLGFVTCCCVVELYSMGVLSTYFHREIVPSYTRYCLRWTYTLRADDDGQFNTCHALYLHDNMEEIKALEVNFDGLYKQETEEGRAHVISYRFSKKNGDIHESEKNNLILEFDNRTGTTELTKEKVLLSVCTMDYVDGAPRFHIWTSFKSYGLVREAYYYKYLTFNANGGVGTMSEQEIENSGKLNTARFTRTGYTFQGWAKTPNGAVEYADGAEITATEADKGPVTLYAVWKADPANVVAMINTIGEVVYTDGCKARIDAAREVYDKLSAEDKALVTNYSVLQAAENTYAAVKDVVTKINAIGSVSYPGSGTAITTAQTAYDALPDEQKAIVINIGVLRTAQDQYAVLGVANQISAIGDVAYTSECKSLIDAARTAYDALSAGQKTQVANYDTLLTAETAYQQAKADAGNTTINFVGKDDATLRNQKRMINYPAAPEVTDYVFQYWQAMEGSLSGGVLLVKAVYAKNIILADNADNSTVISENNGNIANVTLSGRTLYKDGDWNTICLPFGIDDFEGTIFEGATVKELDTEGTYDTDKQTGYDSESGTLSLYFKNATSIVAGVPYLVKWESAANITNPVFTGVTVSNVSNNATSTDGKVQFRGNYSPVELTGGDASNLYLGTNNKLYWPSKNRTMNAFRGYFHVELGSGQSQVRAFVLNLDGETATGVSLIDNGQLTMDNYAGADEWYTLDGRKLNDKPTQKGIYIHNGKKIIVN